jgi:hypothetical protein
VNDLWISLILTVDKPGMFAVNNARTGTRPFLTLDGRDSHAQILSGHTLTNAEAAAVWTALRDRAAEIAELYRARADGAA